MKTGWLLCDDRLWHYFNQSDRSLCSRVFDASVQPIVNTILGEMIPGQGNCESCQTERMKQVNA